MSIQSENDYKLDFEILDRYLNFSSELLRISLLAMGGFGAILLINLKNENENLHLSKFPSLFISICFFSVCAGLALFHRFYASDSMSWYISYLRAKADKNEIKSTKEQIGMHKALHKASIFLILTEIIFAVGIIFFAAGIYQLIFK